MNPGDNIFFSFEQHLFRTLPRVLSQLDRDPDSPTFGSFDRDHWHYKIRDFSSIVLQQAMLILEVLYDYAHADNPFYRHPLAREWGDASLRFWASRQLASGAFDEYYPFEEGYPPTAFSLHAVALLVKHRGYPALEGPVTKAIQKAIDWLMKHKESEALNQEAAGLTAVALLQGLPGVSVDTTALSKRLDDFFAAQSTEGWFPEYGGADIGYLSVTIDCLWDYYEATGDARALAAMESGVRFIAGMVSVAGSTPVMINSRNTDYIAPYGLIRMAVNDPVAKKIVEVLFGDVGRATHFLHSTDDRYICHYLYQSCFRGVVHLGKMTGDTCLLPCETGGTSFLPDSGLLIRHYPGRSSLYVAGRKGGVTYAYSPRGLQFADFGWRQNLAGGAVALTHWQDPKTEIRYDAGSSIICLDVRGAVTVHRWLISTVARHLLLRLLSFIGRNRIIPFLKKAMIFNADDSGIRFHRQIREEDGRVVIRDIFEGGSISTFRPVPAPCYSLRHVASAGNFSDEELLLEPFVSRSLAYSEGKLSAEISFDLHEIPMADENNNDGILSVES